MDFLGRNLQLYKTMRDLASRQETCVTQNRMDLFLQLANQREGIRQEITSNEKTWPTYLKQNPSGGLEAGSAPLRKEMEEVIRSIQEIDHKTGKLIAAERDSLLSEMERLKKGQQAVRGYGGNPGRGDARFVDRKG